MKYSQNQLNQFKSFWNDISSSGLQLEADHSNVSIPYNKKGNKIHIKKENEGKFTAYCNGKVTNACIQKGKSSSNPKIRKRATFAANARTWNPVQKHQLGGIIKFLRTMFRKIPLKNQNFLDSPEYRQLQLQRIWEEADSGRKFLKEYLRSPKWGERASRHMSSREAYDLGKFESQLLSSHNPPEAFKPLYTRLKLLDNNASGQSVMPYKSKQSYREILIDPNNSITPRYTGVHESAHASNLNYTPFNSYKHYKELFPKELQPLLDKQLSNAKKLADQLEIDPKQYKESIDFVAKNRNLSTQDAKNLIDNWILYLKDPGETRARGLAAVAYSRTEHTKDIPIEVDGGQGIFTKKSLDNLYRNIFSIGVPIGVGLYATQN